jgi:threonine dehydratase
VQVAGPTIAEGIAVRDVGEVPLALLRELGVEILVVPERAVEHAIALLAEGAKVVSEGAGAPGWPRCWPSRALRRAAGGHARSAAAT